MNDCQILMKNKEIYVLLKQSINSYYVEQDTWLTLKGPTVLSTMQRIHTL